MSLKVAAAKGAAVTLVGQIGKFVIQGASIVILARLIAPDEFGLFVMIASIAGLAAVVGDFGLSAASIQAKRITHSEKSNLFWINTLLGLTGACVLTLSAPLLESFYSQEGLADLTRVMSLLFLFSGLSVQHKAELSRRMKFLPLTLIEVLSQLVGLLAALVLAMYGFGVWALVAQQLGAAAAVMILAWSMSKWTPSCPKPRVSVRSYIYFGANTMGGALTNYASSNIDSVMLGRSIGPEGVGIYGRMFQLFSLPLQQLATPLTRVALPVLASIQDEQERYEAYLKRALGYMSFVFLGGFSTIIISAPYLVPIVLGNQWVDGVPILQILAIGGVFQGLGYIYYWGFLSRAKTNVMFRLSLVSRSLMVVGIVIAAPFGAVPVAWAVALGLATNWLINTVWGLPSIGVSRRRLLSAAWRPAVVFTPLCAAGFVAVEQGYFEAGNPLLSMGLILSAILVYFACSVLAWPSVRLEVRSIVDLARMTVRKKVS